MAGVYIAIKNAPKPESSYMMYVITNDKDTYTMKMSEQEAFDTVDAICTSHFSDDYTIYGATFSWRDENSVNTPSSASIAA